MLRSLHISHFKCFRRLDLDLSPLTLLSGVNGGGKSSVIQALVLLAQTLSEREWGRTLILEGPDLALGSAADVLNQHSSRRQLNIGVSTDSERIEWAFRAEDRRSLSLELFRLSIDGKLVAIDEPLHWLLPSGRAEESTVVSSLRRLSWITAERTGPREVLPLRDAHGHQHVGSRGELAAGLLYWREDDRVHPMICHAGLPQTLFHQVRAHMQSYFPGCDLRVAPIEGASAVGLRIRLGARTDFHRPQNVGFGLTQLFPIIVAALAAQAGDLLIVENPEVHLHPRAQQMIGTLLAQVATTGVQVVMETHSDHVLNGVRLAAKTKLIPAADVAVHFFAPSDGGGSFKPVSPRLDADGRLDSWPDGFFDQFDLALSQLM